MECERSGPADPLRQGDIIAAQPNTKAWSDPWTRFGVVLSADCDLANLKAPNLVYLPIVSHSTFLLDAWIPEEARRLREKAEEIISARLNKFGANLKPRHIERWAENGLVALRHKLHDELTQSAAGSDVDVEVEAIANLWGTSDDLKILFERSGLDLSDSLICLLKCKSAFESSKKQGSDLGREVIERALGSLQSRNDVWLIKELIGLDPDMVRADYGFVVPLRSISTLPMTKALVDRTAWYSQPDKYLRVCRLRGIYKADLIQQFANLFTRVGIEDYRAIEHRMMFKRFAATLFPEGQS